jgi:hypothetical protein
MDARGPLAARPDQSDLIEPDGPRRRRQLILPSYYKDEAQDQVPLTKRMWQAPHALYHSPMLWSAPATEARTSAVAEATGVPRQDPAIFLPALGCGLLGCRP